MSKVVDLNLTKNERERAAELHGRAIVINTLTGCHGWQSRWNNFIKNWLTIKPEITVI